MRTFTYLLALALYLAGGLAASAQDSSLPFTVSDAPTSDGWAENTTWYFISNGKGNYLSSDNTRTAGDANILQFAASGGYGKFLWVSFQRHGASMVLRWRQ